MNIRSSWNTDRIASASMAKKSQAPRRAHKRPPVKVMKESDLYIRKRPTGRRPRARRLAFWRR